MSGIFNSIRDNVGKSHGHPTAKHKTQDSTSECSERRPSVTEECNNAISRLSTQTAPPEPIPIANKRRRATVFGISNVACDDYVQKDLVSSSWS
ncbi:unnamed protein product [Rhizopus stolonifer]